MIKALFDQLNKMKQKICPNLTEEMDKIKRCQNEFEKIEAKTFSEISELKKQRSDEKRARERISKFSQNVETGPDMENFMVDQLASTSLSNPITGFYGEESFTFSNCGMKGMFGPDLNKCISSYHVEWVKNSDYFSMENRGIQKVKIPISAEFEFTAFGAGWMNYGAMAKANIKLKNGTEIFIGIGQRGKTSFDGCGGTFVAIRENGKVIPIIIAGGAGGGNSEKEYGDGSDDQFGNRSSEIKERNRNIGKEGKSSDSHYYNGGNGFFGRIEGNWKQTETPKSFEDGLNGGKWKDDDYYENYEGGFGGGGHGPNAGGGGYTGGHGGNYYGGGGGGSFTQNGKGIQKGHKDPGLLKIKIN